MHEIEIRPATLKDLNLIVELDMRLADFHSQIDSSHRTGKESKDYFKKLYRGMLRRRESLILLALKSGKPIGFLSGQMVAPSPFVRHRKVAEIEAVNVLPRYRAKRLGSLLVERFIDWAKDRKITQLRASVHAANSKSLKFFKKRSFIEKTITLCIDV